MPFSVLSYNDYLLIVIIFFKETQIKQINHFPIKVPKLNNNGKNIRMLKMLMRTLHLHYRNSTEYKLKKYLARIHTRKRGFLSLQEKLVFVCLR